LSSGDVYQGVGATADTRREWHRALDIFVGISSGEADDARQRLAGKPRRSGV